MFIRLLKESFLFGLNSIYVNKLRTFLSLFGITIGIVSIISVFTILDWMEKAIRDNISSLGDNVLYVTKWPWGINTNLQWWDIIKWPAVSKSDYQAVLSKSTKAKYACLTVVQPEPIKYRKNLASDINIYAVSNDFENIRSFEIGDGRYFSPEEIASGRNEIILGAVLAERLFDNENPVGKQVNVAGKRTTVIGVFTKEGKGGIGDNGMDDMAVIPLNFGKTFINMKNMFLNSTLMIKAKDGVSAQDLSDETTMILRAARRLRPDMNDDFSINRASVISQSFDSVFAGINLGGWVIGGFAILVGGFGIANIMFVSVRERTNQIGIQKALGAKKFFILQQFLVESVLLSVIGGVLGVIVVFMGTIFVNYAYEMHIHLTVGNTMLAIFISGIIGIVAGYAPAYSAARMNPVDAMGFSF